MALYGTVPPFQDPEIPIENTNPHLQRCVQVAAKVATTRPANGNPGAMRKCEGWENELKMIDLIGK